MHTTKAKKLLCLVLSLVMILGAAPLTAFAVGPNETDIIIVDDEFDLEIAKLSATIELNALAGDDASDAVKAIIDNAIEDIEAAMSVSEVEMIVAAAKSDVAELLELNVNTDLMKEVLPFDKNNSAAGGSFGTYYYYEGTYFTVTADTYGANNGVVGGSQWYKLTVAAKDNTVTIDSIEAVVGDYGEAYAYVGISGGEKTETDESGVENGSVVHIKNINASSFSFGGGTDTCAFKDITVYFTVSEPECEHSLIEDYKNNGKTHLQKCELCGEYVAPASHTFDKHVCVCGAKETVEMTETLAYNANNITDGVYSYTGTDFTLTDTQPGDTYGMTVGYGHDFAVEAIDGSLIIESITAVVNAGGSDYATIGVSSGEKEEKGGVDNGTTVHVNNVNASTFSFTGLVADHVCKITDVTVYYTDGTIAHDFTGAYIDNGDTHSQKCTKCDEYGNTENHVYTDGVCVCDAEDPSEFVITSEGVLIKYNGEGGSVEIPNTVVEIAADVFNGCTALTSVELPDTVSAIGNNAFKDCTGLTEVILPEGDLSTIGDYAFAGCTKLTEISIPYGVIGIGSYAFDGCEKLKDLIITDSVRKILTGAFDGDYLENVYFLCIDDGETIETRMSKFGDFNFIQFPHEIEDGECILCGMTEDDILLDEAKKAAISELEAMVSDDSSDEVLIIIDDAYWAIIDEAETVADVEEILNAAKADVAAQIAAEALAEAQADALDVIKTLADADDSDAVKAIITKAITDVRAAESTEAVEAVIAAAEKAVADQKAAEAAAAALAEAKEEAAKDVAALAADGDSDEVTAIIEKALSDIEKAESTEAVEAVIASAEKAVADQKAAEEAAVALAEAKTEAKTAVEALAADGDSDEVTAIIEKALADIETAENEAAVEAIVAAAEKAVADQKAAEEAAAAAAAKALAEAKEEAKAAIDAAAADDETKAAAEEAKAAIDAATTLEKVEAAKAAGLEKIAAASGVCPYCGEKEHKNWIDKLFCIIKRIVKLVFMAFGFCEEIKAL